MQKTYFIISFFIAVGLLFIFPGVSTAQKEEKALEKVLSSKNLKQIYEIRALKIRSISEKNFSSDGSGGISAIHDNENISEYDASGNLIENEIISYDRSLKKHMPVQKWRASLNPAGLSETESLYYYDEKQGGYVESKKWTYEYGPGGNLLIQTLIDAPSGELIEKTVNKFDEKNNKIESAYYKGAKLYSTTFYKYDENKNELESLKTGPDGKIIEKIANSYDQAGLKADTSFYRGPDCVIERKTTYNRFACELDIEKYSGGVLSSTIHNAYDDSGNKTEETEITAGGRRLYLEAYSYDQLNNLIGKTRYDSENRIEYRETYKYDELNRKINEYYYGAGGSELVKSVANKFNDLRKIEEASVSDGGQKPVLKTTFTYEYNQ